MQNHKTRIVAIIPALNEEKNIAKVILRTRPYVDQVIVCDDGSADMTFVIAEAVGAKVVKHSENLGKGEALKTLAMEIMKLDPDVIVTLDGDGQHDPEQIPMLLKPIEAGEGEVVVGSRYVKGSKTEAPLYRRIGLHLVNFLYRKAGVSVIDTQSGFRAFSRKAFDYLMESDAKGYGIEGEQLVLAGRNGMKVMEVPISVNYDNSIKTSKRTPLLHGIDLVSTLFRLAVEERPLMYLGLPGLVLTFAGMALGLYLLWMFNITRYFSLTIAMLMLGAMMIGLLLVISAIILHGLKRIDEKTNKAIRKMPSKG